MSGTQIGKFGNWTLPAIKMVSAAKFLMLIFIIIVRRQEGQCAMCAVHDHKVGMSGIHISK